MIIIERKYWFYKPRHIYQIFHYINSTNYPLIGLNSRTAPGHNLSQLNSRFPPHKFPYLTKHVKRVLSDKGIRTAFFFCNKSANRLLRIRR